MSPLTVLLLLAVAVPAVLAQCKCPCYFSPCGGKCYNGLRRRVTFAKAEKRCGLPSRNATLAVPRSEAEANCAHMMSTNRTLGEPRSWIGYNDRATEGVFVGSDGQPMGSFNRWVPDEQRNEQDCVSMIVTSQDQEKDWVEADCNLELYPVCEVDCLPDDYVSTS